MTSAHCYSSLYPFPIDLNEEVYAQPQLHDLEEEKVYDGQLKSDCELKLSIPKKSTLKFEDQQQQTSSSPDHSCNTIRVCADCNTTKTPLWRSGPRGPKSLCNACGIRQRKARRAMATAAAANGTAVAAETTTTPSMKSKVQQKAKRSRDDRVPHFKNKKSKLNFQSQSKKKLCFEDLRIILSKNSDFHGVFPQDEKEAAILLMALSYGLVHG
ncbi:hypothetical protein V6N13_144805 [Hibiscus sabdariffa]|uniref:Uncharacterized protein n=2 Tax=Hibiscus sabdariffa TaxID=183260 RepID=A0ABR1ZT66_9ROSI